MKYFKIAQADAQKLLDYLVRQPYGDVHVFCRILTSLDEIQEEKPKEEETQP